MKDMPKSIVRPAILPIKIKALRLQPKNGSVPPIPIIFKESHINASIRTTIINLGMAKKEKKECINLFHNSV
jgi:hypothetical protein